MWQKLQEQLLVILVIVVVVIGAAFWLNQKTVTELQAQQELKLAPLRAQNDALKASSDENRRALDATNKLLKDAIAKRESDLFRTDEEVQKLNVERMDALAEAIAAKVMPYGSRIPKSPEEAEKIQNEQVDKVSGAHDGEDLPDPRRDV
jgi:predicted Holliday junction resolvase-like endonuclease